MIPHNEGRGDTDVKRTVSENDVPRCAESINSPPSRSVSSVSSPPKTNAQAYTTEIVKALFGRDGTAGVVVGDYVCSYQRQSGRLYVSTGALFFYSNLFGFEKRIRVQYEQMVEITTMRTTSLYLKTVEGDEYVFRSFQDRDVVLELISRFYDIKSSPPKSEAELFDTAREDKTGDKTLSKYCNEELQTNIDDRQLFSEEARLSSCMENDLVDDISRSDSDISSWERVKQIAKEASYESAVSLKLSCNSASEFFSLFLSDDASHSLNFFHSQIIGDKNVRITDWEKDDSIDDTNPDESLSRSLQFEHKSGLAIAHVTRRQTYRCYGNNACLKNVTNLKGVPSAEAFFVEDIWMIESNTKESGAIVNVSFRVHFTKSTMLRKIIESRSRKETLEWYGKYIPFMKKKLGLGLLPKSSQESETPTPDKEYNAMQNDGLPGGPQYSLPDLDRVAFYVKPLAAAIFIYLALLLYGLRTRVATLEGVIDELYVRITQLENPRFEP